MQHEVRPPFYLNHNQTRNHLRRVKARRAPIKVYDVHASAGLGRVIFEHEQVGEIPFRASWLRKIGVRPDQAMILHVTGNSMEPTIRDGSIVLVDQAQADPKSDHIYAFVEENHLRIKRLRIVDGLTLSITSDHPDHTHEIRTGHAMNAIRVLGRVVWTGRDLTKEF